jgi:capsular exopolysaccharide synthesis family protein
MRQERLPQVLWRRRWIVLVTFLVVAVGTAAVSKTLPKVYATTATLLVAQPDSPQGFDSVQASQYVARSYAELISSDNFAGRVARRLEDGVTRSELVEKTSFETVPETQLLRITAEDRDPERARAIADTYAEVFMDYSAGSLARTTKAEVSLADPAPLPTSPARPKPTLYTLVAGVLGLGLGIALALLLSLLDRRVRSPEELAELLEVPILGTVLLARNERTRRLNDETYRVLRTNLDFVQAGHSYHSLTVVSPSEGDGKTTTALSLARAMCEAGNRVIVVEGDMRRPALARSLSLDLDGPDRLGLSHYLAGTAHLEDAVHETHVPLMLILPSGPAPPAPSALLDTERGRTLLERLKELADIVVVDTPPLSVGAEASLFSTSSDACLLVVDLRRSTVKAIGAAVQQLLLVKAPLVGAVVNRTKQSRADSFSYGYHVQEQDRKGPLSRLFRSARQKRQPSVETPVPGPDLDGQHPRENAAELEITSAPDESLRRRTPDV